MKAAIISDIHVTQEIKEEALRNLEETVEAIEVKNPEIVIVLGDMIGGAVTTGKEAPEESEGVEELQEIRERIEELSADILYLRGNHEQDVLPDKFENLFDQESYGLKKVSGENLIYLDSSAPELSGSRGQISREQLDFLDEKLAEVDEAFLVIHHPIHFRDLSHSYYWDVYPERAFCGNKKEINNVLEKHDNVKMVLNSHIHDLDLTRFGGNIHYTNPPFISESREEGFKNTYSIIETFETVINIAAYSEGERKASYEI